LKKAAHSSSSSVPFVWIVYTACWPRCRYCCASSTDRSKKSRPIIVGSPPCQAIVTSGTVACASTNCRTYVSSRPSAIRNRDPGYSISFERKKQYAQSRLHTAPVGFASR
jgi:hypothetical protein